MIYRKRKELVFFLFLRKKIFVFELTESERLVGHVG